MSAELLPCPFCGMPGIVDHVSDRVGCGRLTCHVVSYILGTGDKSNAAWNTRATPENGPLPALEIRDFRGGFCITSKFGTKPLNLAEADEILRRVSEDARSPSAQPSDTEARYLAKGLGVNACDCERFEEGVRSHHGKCACLLPAAQPTGKPIPLSVKEAFNLYQSDYEEERDISDFSAGFAFGCNATRAGLAKAAGKPIQWNPHLVHIGNGEALDGKPGTYLAVDYKDAKAAVEQLQAQLAEAVAGQADVLDRLDKTIKLNVKLMQEHEANGIALLDAGTDLEGVQRERDEALALAELRRKALIAVPDASKWPSEVEQFVNYKAALMKWWELYGDLTVVAKLEKGE